MLMDTGRKAILVLLAIVAVLAIVESFNTRLFTGTPILRRSISQIDTLSGEWHSLSARVDSLGVVLQRLEIRVDFLQRQYVSQ